MVGQAVTHNVVEQAFFHVTRKVIYNPHVPLTVGCALEAGTRHNPFFAFYDNVRAYPVRRNGIEEQLPAIAFLKGVANGNIQCPTLPQIALETVQHYANLSREIIMEQIRKEVAPGAPSRQNCLWVADSLDGARWWQSRLGGESTIVRLRATGAAHKADAAFLLVDTEPLSTTIDKAKLYWLGRQTEAPEFETLFSGRAVVEEVLPNCQNCPAPPPFPRPKATL